MAKANNLRAEDKAAELKQLNKSIFRPVVVWNKVSTAILASTVVTKADMFSPFLCYVRLSTR